MPVYEYVCQDCGTKFERRRSYDQADNATQCSSCESPHTKRALSRFFVRNTSGSTTKSQSGCGSCSGGSCSSCSH